jgi:protein-tyrosine-phosphatase
MAEAFARMHGDGKIIAYSAGTRPASEIDPKAIEVMKEVGYDLAQHGCKPLAQLANVDFEIAIAINCADECSFMWARQRDNWDIPDPTGMALDDYRDVRDDIEKRVQELLGEMG